MMHKLGKAKEFLTDLLKITNEAPGDPQIRTHTHKCLRCGTEWAQPRPPSILKVSSNMIEEIRNLKLKVKVQREDFDDYIKRFGHSIDVNCASCKRYYEAPVPMDLVLKLDGNGNGVQNMITICPVCGKPQLIYLSIQRNELGIPKLMKRGIEEELHISSLPLSAQLGWRG